MFCFDVMDVMTDESPSRSVLQAEPAERDQSLGDCSGFHRRDLFPGLEGRPAGEGGKTNYSVVTVMHRSLEHY